MAKREHIKTTHQPFIDMPLTYGDLTDHISGGSVVNNGHCSWDSNVGAYHNLCNVALLRFINIEKFYKL